MKQALRGSFVHASLVAIAAALGACAQPPASPVNAPLAAPKAAVPAAPLALTPPIGFNNLNAFVFYVNEALIKDEIRPLLAKLAK